MEEKKFKVVVSKSSVKTLKKFPDKIKMIFQLLIDSRYRKTWAN